MRTTPALDDGLLATAHLYRALRYVTDRQADELLFFSAKQIGAERFGMTKGSLRDNMTGFV